MGVYTGESYNLSVFEQMGFTLFMVSMVVIAVLSFMYGSVWFHQQKIQQIWK